MVWLTLLVKTHTHNMRNMASESSLRKKQPIIIDFGNPWVNTAVDAFFVGATATAARVAIEDTYSAVNNGNASSANFENTLERMRKEGIYWGTLSGIYRTTQYGLETTRGKTDWKNFMIGGALSGALMSASSNHNKERVLIDAIVCGLTATTVEFVTDLVEKTVCN